LQYSMKRKTDGPQSRSGRSGEEKNLMHLPGMEPRFLGSLVSNLSIIPTELYWLICQNGLKFYSEKPEGKIPSGISRYK